MSDGDPEDWPAQPVELRQLERSLRCQICQELYQGPVALKCGHTFCSLCIRNCLSVFSKEGRPAACPTCRNPTDQADLRPVTHLRDACAAWRAVRQLLLHQHLQAMEQQQQQPEPPSEQPNHAASHRRVHSLQQQQQQQSEPSGLRQLHKGLNHHHQGQQRQQPHRAGKTPSGAVFRQGSGYSRAQQSMSEPAITISSNGAAGSDSGSGTSATAASEEPGDEADSQRNDSDADWAAEDIHHQQQQQQQRQQGASGMSARPGSICRLRWSSSTGNPEAALPCSPEPSVAAAAGSEVEGDVIMAEDDSDFEPAELPAAKRVKGAAQQAGPGKENMRAPAVQQHESSKGQSATADNTHQQPPAQQPGYVACPVCSCSVKATFINSHIDACLTKTDGPQQQQQQQQQQPTGHTAAHNQQQPATAATGKQRLSASPADPAGSAVVPASAGSGGGRLLPSGVGPARTSAAGVGGSAAALKRGRAKVLDAPPKLCFELMKEKELKAKLATLGLSNEGNKKVCTERYTSFRNFVLSLKDSGSSMTLKEAAADFTRQQRKITRAASRPQSVAALAGAGTMAVSAGAGAAGHRVNSRLATDAEAGSGEEYLEIDHSYGALIQQTRERMANNRKEAEQQQQQQQQQQQMPEQQRISQRGDVAAEAKTAADMAGLVSDLRQEDVGRSGQHEKVWMWDGGVVELQTAQHPNNDLQQRHNDRRPDNTAASAASADPKQQLSIVAAIAASGPASCVETEPAAHIDTVVPESEDELY